MGRSTLLCRSLCCTRRRNRVSRHDDYIQIVRRLVSEAKIAHESPVEQARLRQRVHNEASQQKHQLRTGGRGGGGPSGALQGSEVWPAAGRRCATRVQRFRFRVEWIHRPEALCTHVSLTINRSHKRAIFAHLACFSGCAWGPKRFVARVATSIGPRDDGRRSGRGRRSGQGGGDRTKGREKGRGRGGGSRGRDRGGSGGGCSSSSSRGIVLAGAALAQRWRRTAAATV